MSNRFSKNIARVVEAALILAAKAKRAGDVTTEFGRLEKAHVIT